MTDAEEQLVCIVLRQRVIIAFKNKSESGSTGDEEKSFRLL